MTVATTAAPSTLASLLQRNSASTGASATGSSATGTSAQSLSDTFLKLLVAQMNNQDPLNPVDNSQITSQMAQISTVTGISSLNSTVNQLVSELQQSQAVQSAQIAGRTVLVPGNSLPLSAVSTADIDRLLGCVLSYSDENFDTALELGFASAIRREWAWRQLGLWPDSGDLAAVGDRLAAARRGRRLRLRDGPLLAPGHLHRHARRGSKWKRFLSISARPCQL